MDEENIIKKEKCRKKMQKISSFKELFNFYLKNWKFVDLNQLKAKLQELRTNGPIPLKLAYIYLEKFKRINSNFNVKIAEAEFISVFSGEQIRALMEVMRDDLVGVEGIILNNVVNDGYISSEDKEAIILEFQERQIQASKDFRDAKERYNNFGDSENLQSWLDHREDVLGKEQLLNYYMSEFRNALMNLDLSTLFQIYGNEDYEFYKYFAPEERSKIDSFLIPIMQGIVVPEDMLRQVKLKSLFEISSNTVNELWRFISENAVTTEFEPTQDAVKEPAKIQMQEENASESTTESEVGPEQKKGTSLFFDRFHNISRNPSEELEVVGAQSDVMQQPQVQVQEEQQPIEPVNEVADNPEGQQVQIDEAVIPEAGQTSQSETVDVLDMLKIGPKYDHFVSQGEQPKISSDEISTEVSPVKKDVDENLQEIIETVNGGKKEPAEELRVDDAQADVMNLFVGSENVATTESEPTQDAVQELAEIQEQKEQPEEIESNDGNIDKKERFFASVSDILKDNELSGVSKVQGILEKMSTEFKGLDFDTMNEAIEHVIANLSDFDGLLEAGKVWGSWIGQDNITKLEESVAQKIGEGVTTKEQLQQRMDDIKKVLGEQFGKSLEESVQGILQQLPTEKVEEEPAQKLGEATEIAQDGSDPAHDENDQVKPTVEETAEIIGKNEILAFINSEEHNYEDKVRFVYKKILEGKIGQLNIESNKEILRDILIQMLTRFDRDGRDYTIRNIAEVYLEPEEIQQIEARAEQLINEIKNKSKEEQALESQLAAERQKAVTE